MEVANRTIEFGDRVTLIPIGDIHLGSKGCDKKRATKIIDWILARPDTYAVGMGDYADLIPRQDSRRFDADNIDPALLSNLDNIIPAQRDMVLELFGDLSRAGKLLGMLGGNHEQAIKKNYSMDFMDEVCKGLDTPNLGYSCLYRLTLRSHLATRNIIIYLHHGHGANRRSGAGLNRLEDAMMSYEADIYLMGHNHDKIGKRKIRLSTTSKGKSRLVSKPCILGRTGTFLRTAETGSTSYAEIAGYPPTDLGVLRIDIRFQGKHSEIDLHVSE